MSRFDEMAKNGAFFRIHLMAKKERTCFGHVSYRVSVLMTSKLRPVLGFPDRIRTHVIQRKLKARVSTAFCNAAGRTPAQFFTLFWPLTEELRVQSVMGGVNLAHILIRSNRSFYFRL